MVWDLAYGRTYGHADSQVTTKIFEIDGLPNFLRYGALLMRLRHAGALLIYRICLKSGNLWGFVQYSTFRY